MFIKLSIGFCLLSTLALLSITPSSITHHFISDGVMNLLHFPSFLLLTLWLQFFFKTIDNLQLIKYPPMLTILSPFKKIIRSGHLPTCERITNKIVSYPKESVIPAAAISIALGWAILLELIHFVIGRQASIGDLGLSLSGVLCGTALLLTDRHQCRYFLAIIATVLIGLSILLHYALPVYYHRYPNNWLGNFDREIDTRLWILIGSENPANTISHKFVSEGKYSLELKPQPEFPWTGAIYRNQIGLSFEKYSGIYFQLYSSHKQTLNVRLDSELDYLLEHRVDFEFEVVAGWNNITVSFDDKAFKKKKNFSKVKKFSAYVKTASMQSPIYLDNIRLLPKESVE